MLYFPATFQGKLEEGGGEEEASFIRDEVSNLQVNKTDILKDQCWRKSGTEMLLNLELLLGFPTGSPISNYTYKWKPCLTNQTYQKITIRRINIIVEIKVLYRLEFFLVKLVPPFRVKGLHDHTLV